MLLLHNVLTTVTLITNLCGSHLCVACSQFKMQQRGSSLALKRKPKSPLYQPPFTGYQSNTEMILRFLILSFFKHCIAYCPYILKYLPFHVPSQSSVNCFPLLPPDCEPVYVTVRYYPYCHFQMYLKIYRPTVLQSRLIPLNT